MDTLDKGKDLREGAHEPHHPGEAQEAQEAQDRHGTQVGGGYLSKRNDPRLHDHQNYENRVEPEAKIVEAVYFVLESGETNAHLCDEIDAEEVLYDLERRVSVFYGSRLVEVLVKPDPQGVSGDDRKSHAIE